MKNIFSNNTKIKNIKVNTCKTEPLEEKEEEDIVICNPMQRL